MRGVWDRLLGLCLPPLLLCALDGTLTLLGQAPAYWAGDYRAVNEASPTLHHLLRIHPAAFAAGLLAWAAVFVGLIVLLPDTLALMVGIAVTFGHTAGAATWLLFRFQYSYQACNGLFLASAVLLGLGIRWGWRARPAQACGPAGWPAGLRWALVAVLCGVAAYLFLWPRTI
jgi:hypothetical protein